MYNREEVQSNLNENNEMEYKITAKFAMYLLEERGFIKNYTKEYMDDIKKNNTKVTVYYDGEGRKEKPYAEVEEDLKEGKCRFS